MEDLVATGSSCYTAPVLGPPRVLPQLIAVAVRPGVTILADTTESADDRSADTEQKDDDCNPPQRCAIGSPLKRLGIQLYLGRHRMAIQARSVLPSEFADQVLWQIADFFVDRFLSVRPGGVAVRVIGFQHDVVDADAVVLHERR